MQKVDIWGITFQIKDPKARNRRKSDHSLKFRQSKRLRDLLNTSITKSTQTDSLLTPDEEEDEEDGTGEDDNDGGATDDPLV